MESLKYASRAADGIQLDDIIELIAHVTVSIAL
jgi:hypothetical protein